MYDSKLLSKVKWLLAPLMLILMVVSMLGMITPAKAAETDSNSQANVNLRDRVTEDYIKEHIDSKYTSADKTELKNLILVKQTLFDGSKLKENENLDIMYKPFDNFDKLLGQFMTNVPVYNLSDNSNFYVAYINTMQNNNQAHIRDYDFAKNNDNGELVEGCILDKETGLAYIPKSLFASEEAGKESYIPLQVQLMQVVDNNSEDISIKTCSATQTEDQSIKSGENTFNDLYADHVSTTVEKNLDPAHIAVYVNGVIIPAVDYQYNPETGVINVSGSPASINTVTVEKINDTEVTVANQIFDDVDLKTQSINYNTDMNYNTTTPLKIPKDTKVGDYVDGTSTYYYIEWTGDDPNQSKYAQDIPELQRKNLINLYNNGTLRFTYRYTSKAEDFMKWVNDGSSFTEGDAELFMAPTEGEYRWLFLTFMADFADGKADFKFPNGRKFDVTPLQKEMFNCVHIANPSSVSNLNNGEVEHIDWDTHKFSNFPMRMRFYKITDDYAVIGIIGARSETRMGGLPDSPDYGKVSDQATYGLIKVPIQKVNLNLRIEKDDESGTKLTGADMELYKNKVEGDPYAFWNTSEDDGNPKNFENIEAGKYVLVEKNAPKGYTKVDPIEFTLKDDGTVEINKDPSGKAKSEMVDGVATIKVADPKELNPTGDKTETNPGDGQAVKHGQEITYEITTTNKYTRNADVVITDPLDKGLDFVTADNGGSYNENTRTITWSFNNVAPNETKKVTFKAKVNESAEIKVVNDAKIVYDNDYEINTKKVQNPIPEPPVKAEPTPGENKTVSVGGDVTYEVTQKNYKDAPADIVFTDHLDSRVDFVTADNDGHYDENTHTITWTIKNVPSGQIAKVGFTVKVNEKAKTIIENQAIAKVGNDPEQETNIIKNPLDAPPVKTEPTPGENKTVKVGDEVKYEVSQKNYRFEAADIVITDHLDKGVDFVTADNNGHYDKATHTITWTIKNVASDSTAKVGFTVKVNEKAQTLIENKAIAKVGNDPEKETNIIRNPIPEPPVKAEPTPGENKTVNVGDEVTYEVSQKNYKFEAADIVFTDHLDERVDFVSVDNGGVYDENTHTITWTIKNVPAGETAKVGFIVKVNDKAIEIIENQAIAKVGDDPEQETNIIKNPLPEPPIKTEPKPGENEPVSIGDEVSYEVAQKNYKLENTVITITDHLDERVDFVSADNDGAYDKATHTITWTIKDVPAGETAKVGFVVKVNDKATEIIENQAIAKVGDDPEQETNIIKNPLKTPVVKTEITPGEGKQVKVGDEVTYKVHFMNYRLTPETVVVTDKLDPGVDFVSTDNNGTYDQANHMIVWTFKDMEARKEQDVTFKVKVNSKAGTVIRNQAEVQVGNDPVQKTNIIENPLAPGSAKTGVNGNNNLFNIAVIAVIGLAILGCGVYFINKKQKEEKDVE